MRVVWCWNVGWEMEIFWWAAGLSGGPSLTYHHPQVQAIHDASRFEEEIKAEQEEKKKQAEELKQRKAAFKELQSTFKQ